MTNSRSAAAREFPSPGVPGRFDSLPVGIRTMRMLLTLVSLGLFVLYWCGLPVNGQVIGGSEYAYLLFALLSVNLFTGLGVSRRAAHARWYDYAMTIIMTGLFFWFFLNAREISIGLWTANSDELILTAAVVMGLLAVEAGRRAAGTGFALVVLLSVLYSLFADNFPGMLYGYALEPNDVVLDFAFGSDGLLGVPASLLGRTVLGFYFFAATMLGLGGGEFFMRLATALMGSVRGGSAKVAVLSSGFFGSLSGSTTANVAVTGSFSIPAMKRAGYSAEYAAATEACASSGGDTMPPVMGGLAFIATVISGVEYSVIMAAAFLPSLLYYFSLMIQVDGYAAKNAMAGAKKSELPDLGETMRRGWQFLASIGFLMFGLLYMRWGAIAPVYASGIAIVLSAVSSPGSVNFQSLKRISAYASGLLSFSMAIFLPIGFIMVSLYKTGVAAAVTSWVLSLGGGNVFAILLIGAFFNILMGMIGLQRTSYIFLSVTMAPALASVTQIEPVAIHLFIIFYAGLGGLTPPVALTSLVASGIAGADARKTAWTSLRMGAVLFVIPFYFVLQPAFLLQAPAHEVLIHAGSAFAGVFFFASALEGYMAGLGRLTPFLSIVCAAAGLLMAFPAVLATLAGAAIMVAVLLAHRIIRKSGSIQEKNSIKDGNNL